VRLSELLDISVLQKLADANYKASGMPIGIIDATDGSVLVGSGWQDVCTLYHRATAVSLARCRESDDHIKAHLDGEQGSRPCEYRCRNGLRDIGLAIRVAGQHVATLFLGQFFYEGETPDREFFARQARDLGFDVAAYLSAVDRVPVFARAAVENTLAYNQALASFISDLAEGALGALRMEDELREQARRKDEFLKMLSHELRNPLAPIRNALHVLTHAGASPAVAERATRIAVRQVTHLSRIVDDLLDVSRVMDGHVALDHDVLDLTMVARRAAEDYGAVMDGAGLRFATELAGEPAWVTGDETRLVQIIGNLLHNAVKFTPSGGTVTLSVGAQGSAAEIRVRDTGRGMSSQLLDQAFEPFTQASQGLARTEGGLGIGLALVKGLALLHGGTVAASSAGAGRGTEVVVSLPLAAPLGSARRASGDAAGTPQRRVLVVDDHVDAADTLAELVRIFGHDVRVARDGPTALALADAYHPDVVLCDLGMPGMSGYEVARSIRRSARGPVRLVAVSGYAQPGDVHRAADAGFDAHVPKPPDPERIRALLAHRDRAAVRGRDLPDDEEPQAQAPRGVAGPERIEQARQEARGDRRACVGDLDLDGRAAARDAHVDGGVRGAVLEGVRHEVADDLLDARRIERGTVVPGDVEDDRSSRVSRPDLVDGLPADLAHSHRPRVHRQRATLA
jgi:signal transduction histidine kinase/CheY-like chemotaxis protein